LKFARREGFDQQVAACRPRTLCEHHPVGQSELRAQRQERNCPRGRWRKLLPIG